MHPLKTFKCPHISAGNIIYLKCQICGELKPVPPQPGISFTVQDAIPIDRLRSVQ